MTAHHTADDRVTRRNTIKTTAEIIARPPGKLALTTTTPWKNRFGGGRSKATFIAIAIKPPLNDAIITKSEAWALPSSPERRLRRCSIQLRPDFSMVTWGLAPPT